MHERIKELRTELGLSQAAFGEKIGLKQKALGLIERGKNKLTERNFNAICRVFKVNPAWLRDGIGEMFDTTVKSTLDVLCEEYELGEMERQMLEMYLEFPAEQREIISAYIKQTLELTERLFRDEQAAKERRRQELLEQRDSIDKELAKIDGDGKVSIAEESLAGAG